jgi:hypothetical protein
MAAKKHSSAKRVPARRWAGGESLDETSVALCLATPLALPAPGVKERLLARIRASQAAEGAGWKFGALAAAAGDWVPLPFPGVRMREITTDAERDTALLYVEMSPGAIFPDHDHTATERGLVLSGDLRTGDRLLGAGEFYEAAAGTRHERVSSPSGCTGLLWVGGKAWASWRRAMAAMVKGTKA